MSFSKVLVANRGEIALRIVRACREMRIGSVAVHSEADARAPHVREADEAVNIGPAPSAESYLRGEKIIEAAKRTGAQAIHPGYGFLSEREWFARAVRDAGLVFIGPPAEAIAAMGSKTAARQLAIGAKVPVVPGTTTPLKDAGDARTIADEFGYPVLLKAAAGGGGKGMRVVRDAKDMESSLESARREAKNAFGDDAVYVEKYIAGPRHVEIQVLGDQHGTILSLNERECSVQRRHQKMIEESPSVAVNPELRRVMGETAVRAARAAGYVNAGTCEFLLDRDGKFYFLEMNTRLQVEHPVTEMVTSQDLVHWQIRIARGERLSIDPEQALTPRGHAIECRIYAEDPDQGFMPSPGLVRAIRPSAGPGVRDDSGVLPGYTVPVFYDSLIAKLIAWGASRTDTISRMLRALQEYEVIGVRTTIPFFLWLLREPDFLAGRFDTTYLDRLLGSRRGTSFSEFTNDDERAIVIATAVDAMFRSLQSGASRQGGGSAWTIAGRQEALR